ncbi:MAG: DUF4097 family beta strand repeat-containing protein [Polaribacter sp.]|nr:DUF4097 family beta strand repeat-containing protein [Polaribacter sp.]MDC1104157.1 DUF4097 family beta strand repeat-containing protein [Polaribacter sp.]MDC1373632.1 DUF4097 family beta strand repeat-containing protein [Polaribacter sp.]MDG1246656.1 DUF4097 family beta strand repeat-containing protein [Polaribacter sp.]MDG1320764.1 DUF4097 family beta strand repeat-containing protein [Polaribacter sp.]
MKKSAVFFFLLFLPQIIGAQKKVIKKVQTTATQVEISTIGLDDFVLKNSNSEFLEIYLFAENPSNQHIVYNASDDIAKIEFQIPAMVKEAPVFRKFITKRLQRASAIIKIPKNKAVIIFGEEINIAAKSYSGPMDIYIEKGLIKLDTIQKKTKVKFYEGSVLATLKAQNIDVASTRGTIAIDQEIQQENFYKKTKNTSQNFTIRTTKGNIFLTTLKP